MNDIIFRGGRQNHKNKSLYPLGPPVALSLKIVIRLIVPQGAKWARKSSAVAS